MFYLPLNDVSPVPSFLKYLDAECYDVVPCEHGVIRGRGNSGRNVNADTRIE